MPSVVKTYRKGLDDLRTHVTVRCCGHMHKIGLSVHGELILFDHTPDEIQRFLTLGELGSEPARCVSIYRAWAEGTINHEKHPRDLSEWRHKEYELAYRVQRKLRQIRLQGRIAEEREAAVRRQLIQEYITLVGPSMTEKEIDAVKKKLANKVKTGSYGAHSLVKNWFIKRVVKELVRRGWSGMTAKPPTDDEEEGDEKELSPLFTTGYRDLLANIRDEQSAANIYRALPSICGIEDHVGFVRLSTGDNAYVSSFSADLESAEAVKLQLAADIAEIGYVNELIREHRKQSHARVVVDFTQLTSGIKKRAQVRCLDLKPADGSSTVVLSITHTRLTIQAAQLLTNAYESIEPKVRAILQANEKRLAAEHRFPPTPYEPVRTTGAIPKTEKIARIPAAWEEDQADDIENDDA